ncbi:MAG: glycosyltransferase family 2 protein [Alphaproteobacteria bacterium]|nr:glycosyltransferase family 2 protein [Alphaproteobacteria bacterium]
MTIHMLVPANDTARLVDIVPAEITIIIPTYKRPDMVTKSIASCLAQTGVTVPYEILVVDNDPAESGRDAVEAMGESAAVPIRYVADPRPGISHVRNTGIAESRARYIAWLDDDEEAEPGWLAAFLKTMAETGADVVCGPCYPRLPEAAAYARRVYTRDARVPTGTRLWNWSKLNGLFDRQRCFADNPAPFDLFLGLAGGGDTLFYRGLIRSGRKIVWSTEATIWETIPADRVEPRYVFKRRFHQGQITTLVRMAVKPAQPAQAALWMAIGAGQVLVYGPLALALWPFKNERWLAAMGQTVGGLGKVLWHPKLHVRLYR